MMNCKILSDVKTEISYAKGFQRDSIDGKALFSSAEYFSSKVVLNNNKLPTGGRLYFNFFDSKY
jgi:hypothetical protein